jgi:hypothetical protein
MQPEGWKVAETRNGRNVLEHTVMQAVQRAKFWSDDFDMDLLKVFPQVEGMLRDPNIPLWTVGHESHGRLNHPACWNSYGAFLWLQEAEPGARASTAGSISAAMSRMSRRLNARGWNGCAMHGRTATAQ